MPTHARIQEFLLVGVQVLLTCIKTLTTCFCFFLFCFISPQLILQKSNDYFQRKVSFSEVPGGNLTFSRVYLCVCVGGGGGASNYLFLIKTHISCNYPGGGVRTPFRCI